MTIYEALSKRNEILARISGARRAVLIANAELRNEIEAYCADDTNFDTSGILNKQSAYETALSELFELKNELEILDAMEVKD